MESTPGSLLTEEVTAHVSVILLLATLAAQVQTEFIDDLDTVDAEPAIPAVRANSCLDALAHFIIHRWSGKLAGPVTHLATRPLTTEGTLFRRPGFFLDRGFLDVRHFLAQFLEHAAHLVARHVVAALL